MTRRTVGLIIGAVAGIGILHTVATRSGTTLPAALESTTQASTPSSPIAPSESSGTAAVGGTGAQPSERDRAILAKLNQSEADHPYHGEDLPDPVRAVKQLGWEAPKFYGVWCQSFGEHASFATLLARHHLPPDDDTRRMLASPYAPVCLWLYPP